jgi:hypothetical protein
MGSVCLSASEFGQESTKTVVGGSGGLINKQPPEEEKYSWFSSARCVEGNSFQRMFIIKLTLQHRNWARN